MLSKTRFESISSRHDIGYLALIVVKTPYRKLYVFIGHCISLIDWNEATKKTVRVLKIVWMKQLISLDFDPK